ncbi:MAG TPA: O-antigen ligase family protein, partial [Solirubrobacteraceae bacterium]|nr:O-antigen ligase family protein [Solirubrobacteraceae bacterium]
MTAQPAAAAAPESSPASARQDSRNWSGQLILALLAAALTVYLSFESGGYFSSSYGLATLVVTFALIARILVVEHPFAGATRRYLGVTAVFAAYTCWTLASALWSHAEGPALTEFSRCLLYLLLLALFGSVPRSLALTRWIVRGLALAAVLVCGAGLITRLLPGVWPTQASFAADRLSYPLTYWNALGVLAAIGLILALGLASDSGESRATRALAAASAPILAATLLLTLSRGAIGSLAIGAAAFVVVAGSPRVVKALIAAVPPTAVAAVITYHASLLNSNTPTSAAAAAQGRHVAVAVLVAAVVAGALSAALDAVGPRVARALPSHRPERLIRTGFAVALLGVLAAAALSGFISREYTGFVQSAAVPGTQSRLTSSSSDGRTAIWSAAVRAFDSSPLHGTGAGTFGSDWFTYRQGNGQLVVDAHNLYL